MKQLLNTIVLASIAMVCLPATAQATAPVYCVNCSNELTQLANKLTMAKQLATQAQQLKVQFDQFTDMATNSKGIGTQLWGNAMSDFTKLQSLMQRSRALAGAASNLDGQFASRYGTYSSYQNQKMGSASWQSKYSQWSNEASDNALYALKGIGMQAGQMQNDQIMMQRLQGMAGSAEGRMQALQVANMLSSQTADQIFKLRQMVMLQAQMQANYLAQQQDKQAAMDAASKSYFKVIPLTRGGKTMNDLGWNH